MARTTSRSSGGQEEQAPTSRTGRGLCCAPRAARRAWLLCVLSYRAPGAEARRFPSVGALLLSSSPSSAVAGIHSRRAAVGGGAGFVKREAGRRTFACLAASSCGAARRGGPVCGVAEVGLHITRAGRGGFGRRTGGGGDTLAAPTTTLASTNQTTSVWWWWKHHPAFRGGRRPNRATPHDDHEDHGGGDAPMRGGLPGLLLCEDLHGCFCADPPPGPGGGGRGGAAEGEEIRDADDWVART